MSARDTACVVQKPVPDGWRRIVDTAAGAPDDIVDADSAPRLAGSDYLVQARSVVVLVRPRN
jgi:hypothetical protein